MTILCSSKQTSAWRNLQTWYNNGRFNECEKWQIKNIKKHSCNDILKTYKRINLETYEIKEIKNPLKFDKEGFCWSENFDGIQIIDYKILLYNLKMVCGSGGQQTRSLREVYHFIKAQKEYNRINYPKIYFINILDGSESYKNMKHFSRFDNDNFIFIGDSKTYKIWYNDTFRMI